MFAPPTCGTTFGAADGPTFVHPIGCIRQHMRGRNKTHTQQTRAIQQVLTQHKAGLVVQRGLVPLRQAWLQDEHRGGARRAVAGTQRGVRPQGRAAGHHCPRANRVMCY
jgi:hypothetical protein